MFTAQSKLIALVFFLLLNIVPTLALALPAPLPIPAPAPASHNTHTTNTHTPHLASSPAAPAAPASDLPLFGSAPAPAAPKADSPFSMLTSLGGIGLLRRVLEGGRGRKALTLTPTVSDALLERAAEGEPSMKRAARFRVKMARVAAAAVVV